MMLAINEQFWLHHPCVLLMLHALVQQQPLLFLQALVGG
jgi:hypothetical protein